LKDNEKQGLRRGIAGQVAAAMSRGLPVNAAQVAEVAVEVATAVVERLAAVEAEELGKAVQAQAAATAAAADKMAGVVFVEPK